MKNFIRFSVLTFSIVLFVSCSNSSDDDIMPIDPPSNNNITYTANVKTIIDSKCLGCHSDPVQNGAPMPLVTFENVKEAVQNRGLINKVETGAMPKTGSPLTTTQVQTIKDWQTGGFIQ